MREESKIIEEYLRRYPQMCLPVKEGMSKSEGYKDYVLRGKQPEEYPDHFAGSEEDCVYRIPTPAGEAEVLYLAVRRDFERAVCCLAYKCEARKIPPSMGAVTISGIINWGKIREHKKAYFQSGGTDWKSEFKQFTSVPENYKDRLLLVSKGGYSALKAQDAGYSAGEWEEKSLEIRIYHELCHFVCRSLFSDKKEAVQDEIVSDCFGILKAVGYYDTELAEKCLGIYGREYRAGGRLENYLADGESPLACVEKAGKTIQSLREFLETIPEKDYWDKLLLVEREFSLPGSKSPH